MTRPAANIAAFVGSTVRGRFDGRPVRIRLIGDPLTGDYLTAELPVCYL
ncbi:hypothetical protein [Streptomyces sp. IBSBF 3136]